MQYRGYEIQIVEYGCIIRNNKGEYVISVDTESEAEDYINDIHNAKLELFRTKIDWYERFCLYCKKLPGKCYINDKLATTNQSKLNSFIKSFENATHTKIHYHSEIIEGERFYLVDQVTIE